MWVWDNRPKGMACVQWKLSLDTSRFGHVSKSGHMLTIQRVKW